MTNEGWVSTEGTVSSAIDSRSKAGLLYSVTFTYVVEGSWYSSTFTSLHTYANGAQISLQYDPSAPEKNSLARRDGYLRMGSILFLLVLGAWGLYSMFGPK